jgi:hypothetical protein
LRGGAEGSHGEFGRGGGVAAAGHGAQRARG